MKDSRVTAVTVGSELGTPVIFGGGSLGLICGPCVIESRDILLKHADEILRIVREVKIPTVFKSSFDKANRSSGDSFRGVGREEGLKILEEVRRDFGVPVLTDIHSPEDALAAGTCVDIVQIPAFLCRQTDLLIAAGRTGKSVNIKKGQFLAPDAMAFAAEKIASTGNKNILLCERGTTFGYGDLVVDFRSLPIMRSSGYPVVFDGTHSVQKPGGSAGRTGGLREMVAPLSRAAVAVGVDGIFLESHPDPNNAPSDGPNMIPTSELKSLLEDLLALQHLSLRGRS